jgi:hypothetical protein
MTTQGSLLLDFVNQVRYAQHMAPLGSLTVRGAHAGDEEGCILAQAMGCGVGGASDRDWEAKGRWVLMLPDVETARAVARVTGEDWRPGLCEVALPELVLDFAVAFYFDLVEKDGFGRARSWLVPRNGDDLDEGFDQFFLPGMEDRDELSSLLAA